MNRRIVLSLIGLCLVVTYRFSGTSVATGSISAQEPPVVTRPTGSAASTGATASAVSPGIGLLRVYDSNNVLIGPVIGSAQYATVAYNVNGTLISLYVTRRYMYGVGNDPSFTTIDCSGPAYMLSPDLWAFPQASIANGSLYVEDTTAPVTSISVQSYLSPQSGCNRSPGTGSGRPALVFPNFSNQFTLPFTIR